MRLKVFFLALVLDLFSQPLFAACLGDLNRDGFVNGADVSHLLATFNLVEGQPGYNSLGDFSGDGAVNGADIWDFISVFGSICP